MLVVADCDSAIMFDAIEEALDPVAKLVDARAERWRIETMVERADIGSFLISVFVVSVKLQVEPVRGAE